MKEIQLSQNKVALVDDEDFDTLNQFKWSAHKIGNNYYASRTIVVDGKHTLQYMHGAILNGKGVDHRDMNGLNNQKNNLRFCTKSENGMNMRKRESATATSIYKGVSFYKPYGKWKARLMINRKEIHLGYFDTEIEAAKAYNAKAVELFLEFANLNNVD